MSALPLSASFSVREGVLRAYSQVEASCPAHLMAARQKVRYGGRIHFDTLISTKPQTFVAALISRCCTSGSLEGHSLCQTLRTLFPDFRGLRSRGFLKQYGKSDPHVCLEDHLYVRYASAVCLASEQPGKALAVWSRGAHLFRKHSLQCTAKFQSSICLTADSGQFRTYTARTYTARRLRRSRRPRVCSWGMA